MTAPITAPGPVSAAARAASTAGPAAPGFPAAFASATAGPKGIVFPIAGQTRLEPHWDGSKAVDLPAATGTPVKAAVSGTARSSWHHMAGNQVFIDGDDGRQYYYAHLHKPGISGRVTAGQVIGEVGSTSSASTGPHLHFAISRSGFSYGQIGGSGDIDPLDELKVAYAAAGEQPRTVGTPARQPESSAAAGLASLGRLLGDGGALGGLGAGLLTGAAGQLATPLMMLAAIKVLDAATSRLGDEAAASGQGGGAAPATPFAREIESAARTHGVPASLIAAVAKAESNFNSRAQSSAGAMGVMELMPATAAALGVKDPWDPAANIDGGARYLRQMMDRYGGDLNRVIQAYNAGPGSVDRFDGAVPFAETRAYLPKVLAYYKDFNSQQGGRAVLA